ncbi:MAG TPA: TIM-barrel domain-containing protein [Verrucomicrobiae bacterium]|nr:TIM-barrel domain-containing protein [Verrucomicrobiae bacterium]
MKRAAMLLLGLLLGLPSVSVADPGNVVSWFSNSLNGLTFTCQTAVVKLDFLDPNVVRVRMEPSGAVFNTNASFAVVENWVRPPISVTDGSTLTITTLGLRVDVSKTPFHLTFRKPDGTVWLTDTNAIGFTITPNGSATNLSETFSMPSGEQYYGLGLVLGKPLSYRGQTRTLWNARAGFSSGAMSDMAVPLVVSSKGYGVFVDNTFKQEWDFTLSSSTQWRAQVDGGELDCYFIGANTPAEALNRYTKMTGPAPVPPRWALAYMQSRYGYRNWSQMYTARDAFRSNDLPCDALILDLYWYGTPSVMGSLTWDTSNFPNPSNNIASLAASGIKTVNIQEEYINNSNQPAKTNFDQAAAAHYLVANDAAMTLPSIMVNNGFYNSAGYVDFLNPAARAWWWGKIKPLYDAGIAGFWTDLGEPEQDDSSDYLYGGHRESEIHNVYNLLWHESLVDGFASNYPNARLYILSRSGFAGDQRFGAAHWTNDTGSDWTTFAAHLNAICNYGLSGLSYFGSDIGGFQGTPGDELYVRWFQFGAFCPVFRAHGYDGGDGSRPTAPYEFDLFVQDHCRNAMKLRYRLLPYVYTAARETFDTGMPVCRALPLAFPNDTSVLTNGSQFMFGSNIMVAPVITSGANSRSVYLPAGKWIDLWGGQPLTGPVTTNWPAPISQIPAFYRDNSITPLGPYVESSQFDDGTQRGLRIYCSTNASFTLYDDDGTSNGYLSNQFATTSISAAAVTNSVTVSIGGAVGSYAGMPTQRTWQVELYCTNAVSDVVADGVSLAEMDSAQSLSTSGSGWYLDGAEHLLRVALPPAILTQSRLVTAYLNVTSPPPYEARINGGGRPYLDQAGTMWVEDRAYSASSFGITGGSSNMVTNAIAGTDDDVFYQSEHLGQNFTAKSDCPNGTYEITLYNAETKWTAAGQRLFNVFIQGQEVLSNYDIFAAAGGSNKAVVVTFTNIVAGGQLQIDFAGVTTPYDSNARISGIRVRKIADPVHESIPPTITLDTPADGSTVTGIVSVSGTASDNVAVAKVEVSVDGGAWSLASGTTNWTFALDTQGLLNGRHTIAARATDGSSNVSSIPSVFVRVINVPVDYLARISAGNPSNATDCAANVWVQDQAYVAGSFGYVGGTGGYVNNPITGVCTNFWPLYQRERYSTSASGYSYLFDCPPGIYEIALLEAETYWSGSGKRVFNVFVQGQQVLTNFDIFASAGGQNIPISRVFTCTVSSAQLEMDFLPIQDNARASGIQVRKIADLDSDSDGIPDWWMLGYFDHPTGQAGDHSLFNDDADGDGLSNLQEYLAGTDPTDPNSSLRITNIRIVSNDTVVTWTTQPNKTNQLERSNSPATNAIWSAVGSPVGGTGSPATQTDLGAATNPPAFYRVRLLQ